MSAVSKWDSMLPWTSDSLRQALGKGTFVLKDNTDGKADC